MTTLKEAIAKGKLDELIKERSKDAPLGDADKAEAILSSMVGKSREAQATSKQETPDD